MLEFNKTTRASARTAANVSKTVVFIDDNDILCKKDNAGTVIPITGVSDGDKGDITVSNSGATWTIDNNSVTTAKLGGDITAAGRAILDDADANAQRTTLGLGTAATQPTSAFASASHTQTSSTITDFAEAVDDRVAGLLVAGTNISLTYNDVANTLTINSTGGSSSEKTYTTETIATRTLTATDKGKLVKVNSASIVELRVPNDTTLSITGDLAVEIDAVQLGTGRVDFVALDGTVTIRKPLDYPNSTQYVVQKLVRIAPNTWTHV